MGASLPTFFNIMPAIFRNYLDFEILDLDNPRNLVFIDGSTYLEKYPEKPILEITLPGFNEYFLVNIAPKTVNVLNANTIGITKTFQSSYDCLVDLPDGVWTFTYRVCPYDSVYLTKNILISSQLNVKLEYLYMKLEGTDCSLKEDRQLKNKLVDIDIFLKTAKAYAKECNITKASNFYQIASKFTDDIIKQLNKFK